MRDGLKRVLFGLDSWPSLLLTLTCVFWAGNTIAGRLAVGQVTPMQLTLLRWVLVIGCRGRSTAARCTCIGHRFAPASSAWC